MLDLVVKSLKLIISNDFTFLSSRGVIPQSAVNDVVISAFEMLFCILYQLRQISDRRDSDVTLFLGMTGRGISIVNIAIMCYSD